MENRLEIRIKEFLALSYGSGDGSGSGSGDGFGSGSGYGFGSGSGSGSGYGSGDGFGSGDGDGFGSGFGFGSGDGFGSGSGSGYGDGSGSGYGDGSGSGIRAVSGKTVYVIDGVQTIIESVSGNFAKGKVLQSDLTLTPCYVARVGDYFAHGDTLRDAFDDARKKALEHEPIEKRIARFRGEYPDVDAKVPARTLYDWHHVLTGSCTAGRNAFVRDNGIDIEHDEVSVREFIRLTKDSYGGGVIEKLAAAYGISTNH